MAAGDYTPTSWAAALLARLGMPTTPANLTAITAWETAEGGHWHNPDRYNPLNTTQPEPGAVSTNSAGVKAYTSWDQGLTATTQTLMNGSYSGILAALANGSSAQDVVSAVTASPWGTTSITLANGTVVPASDTTAAPAVSVTKIPSYVAGLALKMAFVGGAVLLVALGLMRGTAVGRAYGAHLVKGAKLAAEVA